MRRNHDVTATVIFEALAFVIVVFSITIGLIKWLG